jgi:phospholipid/cholesterol/gamma-HCH transport system substrate-binding protein
MNEQAIRFRVGIFVLGALLLLAVLIVLFGGFPAFFRGGNAYTVVLSTAPGVSPGTPVRRSGVKIGEVRKVELDNDTGKVRVDITIDPAFTLRQSDQPTLVQGLLGGDTSIDFLPPEGKAPDPRPVAPGSTLEGVTQADTASVLQKAGEVMPPAKEAMEEMRKVFRQFDKMAPLMEETLKEYRELGKATREMVPELRKTNDEVRELAKSSRQSIPELKKTNEELQVTARSWGKVAERMDLLLQTNEDKIVKALDRLEETLKRISATFSDENQRYLNETLRNVKVSSDKLDSVVRNTDEMLKETRTTLKRVNDSLARSDEVLANMQKATRPMAERSDTILKNIEESTDKLNRLLGDSRDLMHALSRNDGTLQRLLTDPSLYKNLDDMACQVSRMMPRLDRILRDAEIFADKIARHPESLGIGGVVRPGTGLKEPPTVLPWKPWPGH